MRLWRGSLRSSLGKGSASVVCWRSLRRDSRHMPASDSANPASMMPGKMTNVMMPA